MSLRWAGPAVRARGLVRRCLGWDAARHLAAGPTLPAALEQLGSTAYGGYLRRDLDLPVAQKAVSRAALWHLRILAGWGPALDARAFQAMASHFEVGNIGDQARRITDGAAFDPYDLGSLATAWPRAAQARTVGELRAILGTSDWGDPGVDDVAAIRLAVQLAAARRMLDDAPGAADWAMAQAALIVARTIANDATEWMGPLARRDATRLLGSRWEGATSIAELVPLVPGPAAKALRSARTFDDLWRAEARAWFALRRDATATLTGPGLDASACVGAAGLLIADAWLVGAALAVAAAGGGVLEEVLDAQP